MTHIGSRQFVITSQNDSVAPNGITNHRLRNTVLDGPWVHNTICIWLSASLLSMECRKYRLEINIDPINYNRKLENSFIGGANFDLSWLTWDINFVTSKVNL